MCAIEFLMKHLFLLAIFSFSLTAYPQERPEISARFELVDIKCSDDRQTIRLNTALHFKNTGKIPVYLYKNAPWFRSYRLLRIENGKATVASKMVSRTLFYRIEDAGPVEKPVTSEKNLVLLQPGETFTFELFTINEMRFTEGDYAVDAEFEPKYPRKMSTPLNAPLWTSGTMAELLHFRMPSAEECRQTVQ